PALIPFARKGRWKFMGAATLTGATIWLAASSGGASPASGLPEYARRWEFNSLIYTGVRSAFEAGDVAGRAKELFIRVKERLGHPAWTRSVFPFFFPGFFARAFLSPILAGAL